MKESGKKEISFTPARKPRSKYSRKKEKEKETVPEEIIAPIPAKNDEHNLRKFSPFDEYQIDQDSWNNANGNNKNNGNKNNVNINNLSTLLTSKYKPINKDDLVGLDAKLYLIEQWYSSFIKGETTKCLIIIGPTGSGKTSLIEIFIKIHNLKSLNIDNSCKKSKKDALNEIRLFIEQSKDVNFSQAAGNNSNRQLIFLDEFQALGNDILSTTDILELRNTNNAITAKTKKGVIFNTFRNLKMPPIIIISYDSKGSKLSDLKKTNEVVYINEIYPSILFPWIKSVCSKEKISLNDNILQKVIQSCRSDKRLILNTIENLKFSTKSSSSKVLNEIITASVKDKDVNIYEFIERMFDNIEPINFEEIYDIFETDGYILENLVFENYLDYSSDLDSISKSADSLSQGDIIHSKIFSHDDCGDHQAPTHCTFSLYGPSVYSRSDIKNNRCSLRSSVISNKYYLFQCNEKVLNNIRINQINMDIISLLEIKQVLKAMISKRGPLSDTQIKFLESLYASGWSIETIESVHKHFNDNETRVRNLGIKTKEKLKIRNI